MMAQPQKQKSWDGSWIPALAGAGFAHCRCSHCKKVLSDTGHWTSLRKPPLQSSVRSGERVGVGQLVGVVKYVGDLDSSHTNDPLFVGLKLDDPVGEHDGMFGSKRFFSCPGSHGLIVPANKVHQLPSSANQRKRMVKMPNSTPLERETETNSRCSYHRQSSLEKMLNRPWARSKILATNSAITTVGKCTVNSPGVTPTSQSAPVPPVERTKMKEGEGGRYSNEGDMRVEDLEGKGLGQTREEIIKNRTEPAQGDTEMKTSLGVRSVQVQTSFARSGCANKYTCSKFSGLNGALQGDPTCSRNGGTPEKIVQSPAEPTSGRDTSAAVVVKKKMETHEGREEEEQVVQLGEGDTQTESDGNESFGEVESTDSSFLLAPPPAPPTTAASTPNSVSQDENVNEEVSPSCLVSRQPPSPTPLLTYQESETVVEKAEGAVNEMTSFDGASKKWGGDLRAWLMAGTYQKLKKAIKKGVKELQWQRKIREMETSGHYPTEAKRFGFLRGNIAENRQAAARVKREASLLGKKKGDKLATAVTARAKLELEQDKGRETHKEIMSYTSSSDEGKIGQIKKIAGDIFQDK